METQRIIATLSALLLLLLSFNIVSASGEYSGKIGYIVLNNLDTTSEQRYVNIIQDLGLTVEFIDDSQIPTTNYSQYRFIVVGEGTLANNNRIPVNFVPSLITNTKHLSVFNWSTTVVQTAPNPYMVGRVNNQSHFITNGFPQDFNEYNTSFIGDVALSPITKAPKLKIIVSHPSSTNDGVVATADEGTVLKNGFTSKAKGVFFGINKNQYWTTYSETIFRNSVIWLLTDFNAPAISGINITGITSNSASISWGTNKASNYTFSYGKNGQLTTVLSNSTYIPSRTIQISELEEKTSYSFTIKACNSNGYCSTSAVQTFTTKDVTLPIVTSNSVSNITNTTAKVSVSANELSRYSIYLGTTPGNMLKVGEDTLAKLSSNMTLTGLSENTLYNYFVEVCDLSANCVNSSSQTFTTLDFTAPNMPNNVELSVLNPGNKIRISWQTPSGETPVSYRIYASDDQALGSFNFASPLATTSGNEYTDEAASTSQVKYYIVRAADASGNEENNTILHVKYDIQLQSGSNFVSIPVTLQNSNIDAAMHSDSSYHPVTEIKTYNTATQEMNTATLNGNSWDASQISSLTKLNGYIFKSDSQTKFTFVGYPDTTKQISIKRGMNLVALTSTSQGEISELLTQNPADYKIKEIAKRESDGKFTIATYYSDNDEWTGGFTIEPGKAYWVKANQDFILGVE